MGKGAYVQVIAKNIGRLDHRISVYSVRRHLHYRRSKGHQTFERKWRRCPFGDAVRFILEAFKHYKPIAVDEEAVDLLVEIGLVEAKDYLPVGIVASTCCRSAEMFEKELAALIAQHRFFERDVKPVPA